MQKPGPTAQEEAIPTNYRALKAQNREGQKASIPIYDPPPLHLWHQDIDSSHL